MIPQTLSVFALAIAFAGCNQAVVQDTSESTEQGPEVIPFEITEQNNLKFNVLLNGVDSLEFYFDTGGTELVMKHEAIKSNTSLLDGKNAAYNEEDYEPLESLNSLSIGDLSFDSLTIYPVGVGPDMDGHFGWDLFEGKIVELNYESQELRVHEAIPPGLEEHVRLPIEYTHTLFCIQGSIHIKDSIYQARYLFDTGFQRAVVLDRGLRKKNNFPTNLAAIKESKLRNSAGDVFVNKVVEVDALCFEHSCAPRVPVQLFETPNPARFETHILGGELLKRFHTILDFKNHQVYLKANSLMSLPYLDSKVSGDEPAGKS